MITPHSTDRQVRAYFDTQAAEYGVSDSGSGLLQTRIRQAAAAALLGAPGPQLEVGCGTGLLLSQLAAAGLRGLIGADFSIRMLQTTRGGCLPGVPLAQARAQQLPIRGGCLGTLACVNTIYNLPSRGSLDEAVGEFARVLRRGGLLVFEIRNSANPVIRCVFARNRTAQHPLWCHGLAETVRALDKSGFDLLAARPVLAPTLWLAPAILVVARRR